MLLAERPPIQIPHNFIDGESAVFFDDVSELAERLVYYQAHPHESAAIAQAGHSRLLLHHTNVSRAQQALTRVRGVASAQ